MITLFTPAATKPRRVRAALLRAAYCLFLIGGIFGVGYAGYIAFSAYIYQASRKSTFDNLSRSQAPHRAEVHGVVAGDLIGELDIPRVGINVMVAQGVSSNVLALAVGHIPETPLPGEWGNVALAGHRDSFFRPLRNVERGDEIILKTAAGELRYEVESIRIVPPTDVDVLKASGDRTLTLISCFPFYYVGPAPNRFVVRARQVGFPPD
jgi:sortase A